jgi:hypothetical protein
MAAPSEDSNVFNQILVDHWDGFKHIPPRYHTRAYAGLMNQRLHGGTPDKIIRARISWKS